MSDHRSQPSAGAESGDTTLRDKMQSDEHTVELSAADIVAVDQADMPLGPMAGTGETTQVLEARRLQAATAADDVRATGEADAYDETTNAFDVPAALLAKMERTAEQPGLRERLDSIEVLDEGSRTTKMSAITGPPTQKFQAVNTQPLPRIDDDTNAEQRAPQEDAPAPIEEATSEYAPGRFFEVDKDGFATFIARTDADGNIELPDAVFGDAGPKEGSMVLVKIKTLPS